jgi:hypothetical protein
MPFLARSLASLGDLADGGGDGEVVGKEARGLDA